MKINNLKNHQTILIEIKMITGYSQMKRVTGTKEMKKLKMNSQFGKKKTMDTKNWKKMKKTWYRKQDMWKKTFFQRKKDKKTQR